VHQGGVQSACDTGRTEQGITLMIEAERTSETSVEIQLRTRQYIAEDSELNMEYHYKKCIFVHLNHCFL
jgi:hypothetical protein